MLLRIVVVGEDAVCSQFEKKLPADDVVVTVRRADDFWARPDQETFDLAIVGLDDLPADVSPAIDRLRRLPEAPEVVVHYPEAKAREALALQAAGVFALLPGGPAEPRLARALAKLIARRREMRKVRLRAEATTLAPFLTDQFVSKSPAMQQVLKMARRVAASDTSLLLLGETGAGKDWLARAIHGESARAQAPFIAVNCSAVPENLLESELFGHVKGAFTGAVRNRRGYFELAHQGTLYLDEVGEMPPHLQVRLLRVLQDHVIQRLGSENPIAVDVRIIAATNRNPAEAMMEGAFRQDLYYRLAVITLTVPTLSERSEDIPDLVEHYREKFVRKLARSDISGVTPQAMSALIAYDWPGNVRELINVIERAVLLCDGTEIDAVDLPMEIASPAGAALADELEETPLANLEPLYGQPLDSGRLAVLADFERRYLAHHLERFRGNVGKTARQAGVDPRTLYTKMKQLGLRKEDFKGR